jgi:hypothetical protein
MATVTVTEVNTEAKTIKKPNDAQHPLSIELPQFVRTVQKAPM